MHPARDHGKRNVPVPRQPAAPKEQIRPGLLSKDPDKFTRNDASETIRRGNVSRKSSHGRESQTTQLRNPAD